MGKGYVDIGAAGTDTLHPPKEDPAGNSYAYRGCYIKTDGNGFSHENQTITRESSQRLKTVGGVI